MLSNFQLVVEYNKIKLGAESSSDTRYRELKSEFIKSTLNKPFIRKARAGDEASIHHAHMRSIKEICVKDHGRDEIKGWGFRELGDRWIEAVQTEFVKVIEFNRNIYGVSCYRTLTSDAGDKYGYIHALYLTAEVIGLGLAKKMMIEMLEEARANQVKFIKLDSSITAYKFYKSFGFEDDGPKRKVEIGGYPVTCYPMIYSV